MPSLTGSSEEEEKQPADDEEAKTTATDGPTSVIATPADDRAQPRPSDIAFIVPDEAGHDPDYVLSAGAADDCMRCVKCCASS